MKTTASENRLRRPPRLMPGDAVGIAAPSGVFSKEGIEPGLQVLRDLGLEPLIPPGLFEQQDYLAGADAHRAAILHDLFRDSNIKAVFCARGGYGAMRLLPLLDFRLIAENPKIFMGFSDISVLLSVFYERCNMLAFHGPVMTTLGRSDSAVMESFKAALFKEMPVHIKMEEAKIIRPGRARGRVAGGNLATLCHLLGTGFMPKWENCILALEDINEPAYKIDRMMMQLSLAGAFEGLAGLVLGRFENCSGNIPAITAGIIKTDIPIIAGVDIGHGDYNLVLPLGLDAVLDTDSVSLLYDEPSTLPAKEKNR